MNVSKLLASTVACLLVTLAPGARAQDDPLLKKIQALNWQHVTAEGNIAGRATFNLDNRLSLLDASNTNEFLVMQGNLPHTDTFTVASEDLRWFSIFKFLDEGYVKDDEKIDADALLTAMREGNESDAAERKKRGLPGLFLEGWFIPPRYDQETKRLEWATLLRSDSGRKVVNFSTKILGRHGHMDVVLVSDPSEMEHDILEFKAALKGFDYVAGEKYGEWKSGDKVAAYGLGALVLGGAAAIAAKKGLWAVLGGFLAAGWKILAGVAVAGVAGFKSFFKKKSS